VPQKQQERLEKQENIADAQETPTSGESQLDVQETPISGESQLDVQETSTSGENQPTGETPQKKGKKRKERWVSIEEISPKPSYWPLVLTVSMSVLLMGVVTHPIVIGVGALLIIISIMGWMLERR
jgi:hypothetical protein